MIRTLAALVVVGGACKSGARQELLPAHGSAVDPWGSSADAAPETAATRKQRANQALARVAQIMPKLAKLRGLAFEHEVPCEYQSAADFRTFARAEIAKELPPAKAADTSAALYHVGLLPRPGNLAALEEQAFAT